MRKRSMRLNSCFTLVLFLAASLPVAAADHTVQLEPFLKSGLKVRASINGREGIFLFDTGAGITNVTPDFAAKIGCKPWGQITGFTMMAMRIDSPRCDNATLSFAKEQFPLEAMGVMDINKFMPPGTEHLDGTIGLNAFDNRAFAFSYHDRTFTLVDSKALARLTAKKRSIPIHIVRDAEGLALAINLPVQTAEGTAWFELDSGNTTPFTLIGKHLAKLFDLDASHTRPQPMKLALLDGSRYAGPGAVHNLTMDGNLGTRFLSRYNLIIDLKTRRAWLSVVPGTNPEEDKQAETAKLQK